MELNTEAFKRAARFDAQGHPNSDCKLLKDIDAGVQQIYAQETSSLLAIFK